MDLEPLSIKFHSLMFDEHSKWVELDT